MRFSIRALLAWTILFALGFLALREPTSFKLGMVATLTVQLVLLGGYLVIKRRGASRAFWTAFCVAALSYAFAAFGPWGGASAPSGKGAVWAAGGGSWSFSGPVRLSYVGPPNRVPPRFPPTRLLEHLADWLERSRSGNTETISMTSLQEWSLRLEDPQESFFQTGHLVLSWLAGLLAGTIVALITSLTSKRRNPAEAPETGAAGV